VLDSQRAKEAEVKKEEAERLAAFKKAREEAEKGGVDDEGERGMDVAGDEVVWMASGAGRKRKKGKESGALKGVKVRRRSSAAAQVGSLRVVEEKQDVVAAINATLDSETATSSMHAPVADALPPPSAAASTQSLPAALPAPAPAPTSVPGLGLGGYSSEED